MSYKKKHDYVYMAVTNDEYELPIAFFDNFKECCDYANKKKLNMRCAISRKSVNKEINCRFISVDLEKKYE